MTFPGSTTRLCQRRPDRLKQIVINLLSNAIKYNKEQERSS